MVVEEDRRVFKRKGVWGYMRVGCGRGQES